MKQVLVELDDETAARLDAVAPARSRKRSAFIRAAIHQALWDVAEAETARGYAEQPDDEPRLSTDVTPAAASTPR